jgi:hypothetical protein
LKTAQRGSSPGDALILIFEVAMSKFRKFQATNTVLLGEIEELKKHIFDEGNRFELKVVHYRAQLESQKRGSSTYFQIAKGVVQRWNKKFTRPSPLSKATCQHHAFTSRAAGGK